MATALTLRAAGEHPEIGIRVDKKGIAFDLETGKSLSRGQVDARIAQFQTANPGTNVAGLVKKRGAAAGVWDRNKKVIVPVAAGLLGAATGGVAAPALLGAAARGLDREGKRGVGFDVGQGVRGAVEGGVSGYAGSKIADAIGSQGVGGAIKSGVTKLGSVAKKAGSTLLGGAKELLGDSPGDWLKAGIGAIPAIQGYNRAQQQEKTANTQLGNASAGNAAMADIAKALIARGSAPAAAPSTPLGNGNSDIAKALIARGSAPVATPTISYGNSDIAKALIARGSSSGAPDLSHLLDTKNPYAKKLRPMVGAPGV